MTLDPPPIPVTPWLAPPCDAELYELDEALACLEVVRDHVCPTRDEYVPPVLGAP